MILLLGPDDINGLITMKEAVEAMEQGLKDWAENPELAALRRRVHAPSGARVTVHQGAPASAGVTGLLTHCEQVVIHADGRQTYAVRGRPVRVIYNAANSELLAVTIGEVRVRELPEVNNVAVVPTACATAVGVKWLARKNSRRIGILGSRGQARCQLAACKAVIPGLEEAKVYSPTPENRVKFAAEMTELLEMVPGRTSDRQISFFKNNAYWGVGDQAIGALLYRRALEQGVGTKLPIDGAEWRE
jgi:ornithine cyclodeaminase/alanine dehydrogenase-like protein (mu-crystallin family)